jgi:hypothetical protein
VKDCRGMLVIYTLDVNPIPIMYNYSESNLDNCVAGKHRWTVSIIL